MLTVTNANSHSHNLPPANSPTIHSKLVSKDRHLGSGEPAYLPKNIEGVSDCNSKSTIARDD